MQMTKRVLLGVCPIGKFVFSHEDALAQKRKLFDKLDAWGVRYCHVDDVLPDGMVRDQKHVGPAVEHFRRQGIDALFVPHCNFGTEGAAGMIAAKLGVPVLLWGPRDEAPEPDGTRLRDSLCGMFATSKVLHKLGVPFTYIENCRIDEPPLQRGLDTFLRAVRVAGALRGGIRIGHVGQRIDFFWTTIVNESQLLERFGVEVLPLDMVAFIDAVKDRAERNGDAYAREAAQLRRDCTIEGFAEDRPLVNILAVRDQMLALAEEHGLDGLAVQTFMSLVEAMGAYCSFSLSTASNRIPIAQESDIHGAVSLVLLARAAAGDEPVFLTDVTVRHPANDNGVLLWHTGAPTGMKHPDATVRLGSHWILPSPLSGMTHFRLKDGPITILRFDGDRDRYQLAVGEGRSIDGPTTQNNYAWMEVDDWPRWERQLMEGPFIHHAAMAYGHHTAAVLEAVKYVPGLDAIRLGS